MFLRLLLIETRKTFKHPALWIGLAGLVLLLGDLYPDQPSTEWRTVTEPHPAAWNTI